MRLEQPIIAPPNSLAADIGGTLIVKMRHCGVIVGKIKLRDIICRFFLHCFHLRLQIIGIVKGRL